MTKTLAILIATTCLTAAVAVPAWSAMQSPMGEDARPAAAVFDAFADALPFHLVSDDDDDEDDDDHGYRSGGDDDNDDDDDDDDDDCDDDDRGCSGAARGPARAGTVAPPANGLFGNGAAPQVQVK